MRFITVCVVTISFCAVAFLLFLPQRQWFPDAGTYYLVVLAAIVLCLLFLFWPAFARWRGRYFAMILAVLVMVMITVSILNWFEKQIGADALWNGCIAITLITGLLLLFKKQRRKTGV